MLTLKSWINCCLGNYTLPTAFPCSLKCIHGLVLFFYFSHKLLSRITVMQNVADVMFQSNCFSALGGMNLVCSVCIFTYVKQFRMKGVMTIRYDHHFMSKMSLLDWN